jgi:hypothetical protein
MKKPRRDPDDLLDVARVLLLVQGSILVATTIEALIFSSAFAGFGGSSVLLSAAAALSVLVARTRLRADRDRTRRLLYIVEGVILASLAIDTLLATLITHASPPAVALLTRLVIPASVIGLLLRSTTTAVATPAATPGGVS